MREKERERERGRERGKGNGMPFFPRYSFKRSPAAPLLPNRFFHRDRTCAFRVRKGGGIRKFRRVGIAHVRNVRCGAGSACPSSQIVLTRSRHFETRSVLFASSSSSSLPLFAGHFLPGTYPARLVSPKLQSGLPHRADRPFLARFFGISGAIYSHGRSRRSSIARGGS